MSAGSKLTGLLVAGVLCLPIAAHADTQTAHRVHKAKKQPALPPPLPSGTRGPVPQIPLDAIPAVAPTISYQDGMLTIVAPNSTLGDILRGVRKHTAADIDIPPSASERVATRLGPGPAREVVAELLNGSHFNYVLLGSPENAGLLVRVVLVPKTADTPAPAPTANAAGSLPQPQPGNAVTEAPEPDVADENTEETQPEPGPAEAEQQQPVPPDQPGVKTPQQLLQEMQQRQLQMQQQQQGGQNGQPVYPPPGGARPQPPQEQQ
jgi:hypothetical protein